ncbi:MAG: PEP-CTERM sorting domain-containing protein [Chthonomonas sp.]|nr:PEP-CTERM sorting domain-containing protein [Chthonomonas sp.]
MNRVLTSGFAALIAACASAVTLYDNGPFVTRPGAGPSGSDISEWTVFTTSAGPVASNIGCNLSSFRVIEDFTVPSGQQWKLTEFASFAFRTTTSTVFPPVSSFSAMHIAIHTADPRLGGGPAHGDFATNRYASSKWTGAFRTSPGDVTTRQRPIMEVLGDASWAPVLSSGRYWVEFALQTTSASSAVFAVGVSPVPSGGDALQRQISNGQLFEWAPVTTAFQLRGTVVPEPMAGAGLALGLAALYLRRRKRKSYSLAD